MTSLEAGKVAAKMRENASDQPVTQRQLRYLQAVAREAGYDTAALDNRSVQEFGVPAVQLSRRDASVLIDLIQNDWQKFNKNLGL